MLNALQVFAINQRLDALLHVRLRQAGQDRPRIQSTQTCMERWHRDTIKPAHLAHREAQLRRQLPQQQVVAQRLAHLLPGSVGTWAWLRCKA